MNSLFIIIDMIGEGSNFSRNSISPKNSTSLTLTKSSLNTLALNLPLKNKLNKKMKNEKKNKSVFFSNENEKRDFYWLLKPSPRAEVLRYRDSYIRRRLEENHACGVIQQCYRVHKLYLRFDIYVYMCICKLYILSVYFCVFCYVHVYMHILRSIYIYIYINKYQPIDILFTYTYVYISYKNIPYIEYKATAFKGQENHSMV
jgi:hypothetical protein